MAAAGNHLIDLLPEQDRNRLLALCETVDLGLAAILGEPGAPAPHVYFPVVGFISLLAVTDNGPALEVGMVGREGMVGLHWALGVATSPLRALVQGPGACWRMPSASLRKLLAASPALRAVLLRYAQVCLAQGATSSVCLRFHPLGQRLARWLLMTQDRAGQSSFAVTQAFLGSMLGVRRVGVTTAASALQRRGLISYRRGLLQVLDRPQLLAASCSCYASDLQVYQRVMG